MSPRTLAAALVAAALTICEQAGLDTAVMLLRDADDVLGDDAERCPCHRQA